MGAVGPLELVIDLFRMFAFLKVARDVLVYLNAFVATIRILRWLFSTHPQALPRIKQLQKQLLAYRNDRVRPQVFGCNYGQ